MKALLAYCILSSLLSILPSGYGTSVQHIGLEEGLSNTFVLDMAIDGSGNVWVATENGLNRISGDRCVSFTTDNSDLPTNKVQRLAYIPGLDQLWIWSMSMQGVCVFDCKGNAFRWMTQEDGLLPGRISGVSSSSDGGAWLIIPGTGFQHISRDGVFTDYTDSWLLPYVQSVSICEDDGKGRLFLGSGRGGLTVLDLNRQTAEIYRHDQDDPQSIPGNIRHMLLDHVNNLWIGTSQGLAFFDSQSGSFINFHREDDNSGSIIGDNVFELVEMPDHTLWVSSDLGGISVLNLQDFYKNIHGPQTFTRINNANSGLSSSNTRTVSMDDYGNVWVGSYSSGIDVLTVRTPVFRTLAAQTAQDGENDHYYAVMVDRAGCLWAAGEARITMFKDNVPVRTWDISGYQDTAAIIYILEEDRDGNIWVGNNDNGVFVLDPRTGGVRKIKLDYEGQDIHAFYEDRDGNMWIGAENGVFISDGHVARKFTDEVRIIYDINEDAEGRIWIGSLGQGLNIYSRDGTRLVTTGSGSIPVTRGVNQIYKDNHGSFWVASYNGLIYFPNPREESKYEVYDKRNGIQDDHIRAVQQDFNGNIWVSTFTGVSLWNAGERVFRNFDFRNGVSSGGFVESSAAISPDNIIYFGSPNGVCFFNPYDAISGQPAPTITVYDCEIPENSSDSWSSSRIESFYCDGIIRLKHNKNSLRVYFRPDDVSLINEIEYSYMVEGLMDSWHDSGGQGQAIFWNLHPGKYTFKLRAILAGQSWNDSNIVSVPVEVTPPIWGTWYAGLLIAILVLSLAFYIISIWRKSFTTQMLLEQEKVRADDIQALNDERLRFFTNITHELRTPLTLIIGPLDELAGDKNIQDSYRQKINRIYDSSVRLLDLVNQILEFRKVETSNRTLSVEKGHLDSLVGDIGRRFQDMNRNKDVDIVLELPDAMPQMYFDRDIVTTVLNNLISNAVKYTRSGRICISLFPETLNSEQYFTIAVEDTGCGIDESDLPHVFDRYYQAKGHEQVSGTGIGLALVKSLSDIHEGIIKVSSTLGKGSRISFSLRTDAVYPDAVHSGAAEEEESLSPASSEFPSDLVQDNKPVLLAVEDNQDILLYVQDSLADSFRIFTAKDGRAGLSAAISIIPDIIVSDIMMPQMDGLEMCREIKHDIRTSHIPVILLTAKDSMEDKVEGYDVGADSYLTKPFTARLLLSRINNILEMRRTLSTRLVAIPMEKTENEDNGLSKLNVLDKAFLNKFTSLINDNIEIEDTRMSFYTDNLNMSYSTFNRKVKGLLGITAVEYIRKIKLKQAAGLLASGECNVAEAAHRTGYSNLGNFRNAFKEEFGTTPSEYIKQSRARRP